MRFTTSKMACVVVLVLGFVGLGAGWFAQSKPATSTNADNAATSGTKEAARPDTAIPDVVALIRLQQSSSPRAPDAPPEPTDTSAPALRPQALILAKSQKVLAEALRTEGVTDLAIIHQQADAVGWLRRSLRLSFMDNDILAIGLSDAAEEESAKLVNAVAEVLEYTINDSCRQQQSVRLNRLSELTDHYDELLSAKRRAILQLTGTTSDARVLTASERKQLLMQDIAECTRELRRVRLERVAAQQRLARQRASKSSPDLEERLSVLKAQEEALQEEQKELQGKADDRLSPQRAVDLERLEDELRQTKRIRDRLGSQLAEVKLEIRCSGAVILQRADIPKKSSSKSGGKPKSVRKQ
jgi:hypothetical protein